MKFLMLSNCNTNYLEGKSDDQTEWFWMTSLQNDYEHLNTVNHHLFEIISPLPVPVKPGGL